MGGFAFDLWASEDQGIVEPRVGLRWCYQKGMEVAWRGRARSQGDELRDQERQESTWVWCTASPNVLVRLVGSKHSLKAHDEPDCGRGGEA